MLVRISTLAAALACIFADQLLNDQLSASVANLDVISQAHVEVCSDFRVGAIAIYTHVYNLV